MKAPKRQVRQAKRRGPGSTDNTAAVPDDTDSSEEDEAYAAALRAVRYTSAGCLRECFRDRPATE